LDGRIGLSFCPKGSLPKLWPYGQNGWVWVIFVPLVKAKIQMGKGKLAAFPPFEA
jgi:hypothetical protein